MGVKRILVSLATAVAVLGSVATMATGASVSGNRTQLRGAICQTALEPAARAIGITSVMRPVRGTVTLQMRFDLFVRGRGATTYSTVHGGDLGRWLTPQNATLGRRSGDVWILTKQVVDLTAPATYRLRASYRWVGAHHRLLGSARRYAPRCYEPELRPDLRVGKVTAKPIAGRPSKNRYWVTIANGGATAAGAFTVQFAPGGTAKTASQGVTSLGAHQSRQVSFVGPVCSTGVSPTITIYPGPSVDDYNPGNNVRSVNCPLP